MLTCASGRSISTVVSISLIPNPESLLQQSLRPLSPGSKRRNLPAVTGKVKLSLKTSRRYICLCDSAYQAARGLRSFPNSYISHRTGSMSDAYLGWQRRWTPGAWQTCKGTRCKYPRVLSSSTLPTWRPEVCVQEAEPCVDPGDGGSGTWRKDQTARAAVLWRCRGHMGQHMELFSSFLSRTFLWHVNCALIMRFSAWLEESSVSAKLASLPSGAVRQTSPESSLTGPTCRADLDARTDPHKEFWLTFISRPVLILSIIQATRLSTISLIVIMFLIIGSGNLVDGLLYLCSSAFQRLRDKRGIFQGLNPPSPHVHRHLGVPSRPRHSLPCA